MPTAFHRRSQAEPRPELIKGPSSLRGFAWSEVEDPLMRELRYMDKLVDELASGKKMENIFSGNRDIGYRLRGSNSMSGDDFSLDCGAVTGVLQCHVGPKETSLFIARSDALCADKVLDEYPSLPDKMRITSSPRPAYDRQTDNALVCRILFNTLDNGKFPAVAYPCDAGRGTRRRAASSSERLETPETLPNPPHIR